MRFVFVGTALLLLSGCVADRDRQFAECRLKYEPDGSKVRLCMEAAGYAYDDKDVSDAMKQRCSTQKDDGSAAAHTCWCILTRYDSNSIQTCWVPVDPVAKWFWDFETKQKAKPQVTNLPATSEGRKTLDPPAQPQSIDPPAPPAPPAAVTQPTVTQPTVTQHQPWEYPGYAGPQPRPDGYCGPVGCCGPANTKACFQ